jgi:pimeloyl-ACP methyl ester carboxylesterase
MKSITSFTTGTILSIFLCTCNPSEHKKIEVVQSNVDSPQTTSFKSGYELVNGIKMYYETYGQGKPLVLLHGGGSNIQTSFAKIIPGLSKHRRVIGVELQGNGHTEDRDAPFSFKQDADDVAALLAQLQIDRADFMGFSNGGHTIIELTKRHPQIIDKIILASSFYKRSGVYDNFWDFMKHANIDNMPAPYKEEYKKVAPNPNGLQAMHDKSAHRMQNFQDWGDKDIESIQSPTLIIIGDSELIKPEHAVDMFRKIPHCSLAIIPGGHGDYMGELQSRDKKPVLADYGVSMIEGFLNKGRQ